MHVSPEVEARLRIVQEQLRQSPEFYNQSTFGELTSCGTVCCIAGWLHYNDVGEHTHNRMVKSGREDDIRDHARKLLEVEESDAEFNLFEAAGMWPWIFEQTYSWAETDARRALVAIARIDYYIKTGE